MEIGLIFFLIFCFAISGDFLRGSAVFALLVMWAFFAGLLLDWGTKGGIPRHRKMLVVAAMALLAAAMVATGHIWD